MVSSSANFNFELLTPGRKVHVASVSEVLLPAYDGEVDVLPQHGDFVGLLGTGPLKIVEDGDDFWFMVSAGIYEVRQGQLTILAEVAESATEIDGRSVGQEVESLENSLREVQKLSPQEIEDGARKLKFAKARLEVFRRTAVMN